MSYDSYYGSGRKNKGPNILIILFLFCLIGFAIWFITQKDDPDRKRITESGFYSDDPAIEMNGTNYHYSQLNEDQQKLYRIIYQGCKAVSPIINLSSIKPEDCEKVIYAVRLDHPEFFWIRDVVYSTSTLNGLVTEISFTVPTDTEAKIEKLENKANEILKNAPADDYGKVKYIYEYIINNTDYNMNAPDNQTVYSALINRSSVCGGYASAFLYLCDKAGIYCGYASGDIIGRGTHAWNFVKINDKYYWVDVTWGDPTYENMYAHADNLVYDYLCVSDNEIMPDRILSSNPLYSEHQAYMDFTYPLCYDNSLNYYYLAGCYFEMYDRLAVYNYILTQVGMNGKMQIEMKFANESAYRLAVFDIVETESFWDKVSQELNKQYGIVITQWRGEMSENFHRMTIELS